MSSGCTAKAFVPGPPRLRRDIIRATAASARDRPVQAGLPLRPPLPRRRHRNLPPTCAGGRPNAPRREWARISPPNHFPRAVRVSSGMSSNRAPASLRNAGRSSRSPARLASTTAAAARGNTAIPSKPPAAWPIVSTRPAVDVPNCRERYAPQQQCDTHKRLDLPDVCAGNAPASGRQNPGTRDCIPSTTRRAANPD